MKEDLQKGRGLGTGSPRWQGCPGQEDKSHGERGGVIYLALPGIPSGRLVWFGWTYYGIHQVFAHL